MDRTELKAKAREQLGGAIFDNAWLTALLALLLYAAILSLAGAASAAAAALILSGPMSYGVHLIFLKKVRHSEKEMVLNDFLKGFTDDFVGTFLLGLMSGIFIFLWSLLFIIPGIIKAYAYSMAYYIKADHPEYDWRTCLQASERMTQGHKWDLFVLDLSFIGWYIVGALCFGIGTLWVAPYHFMTRTNVYEQISQVEII